MAENEVRFTAGEVEEQVRERALRQREQHRKKPLLVRAAFVCAGVLTGVAGLVLLFAPEFGLPVLLVGLRLLAYEFDWAIRIYVRVATWVRRFTGWYRRLARVKKWSPVIVIAGGVVVLIILARA
jgi:hypothetical protein